MKKTPCKVSINEKNYRVKEKKDLYCFKKKKNSKIRQDLHGIIHFNEQLIKLNDDLLDEQKVNTLWHEIMHGMIHEYCLPVDGRQEEKLVTQLTNALIEVFKANRKLLRWTDKKLFEEN